MITQGSALGGIPGVNRLSPSPLPASPLSNIADGEPSDADIAAALSRIDALSRAAQQPETGLTPLGEIIAAHQRRDYADAEPVVTGRHQVWGFVTPDRQSRTCRVHCFLGAFALITDDQGHSCWRAAAGLYLNHALSQPAATA